MITLIGPDEPTFWAIFATSAEHDDGLPDPLDRWSRRVLTDVANTLGAEPLFPFGGPPYAPFFTWAKASGRFWASPINFLVHDEAGLFVSFRGALALRDHIDLPPPPANPCDSCTAQPCRTACPIGALVPSGYDTARCRAYLGTEGGADSLQNGCSVRRSCPVSVRFGRLPEQSAYHMQQFKGD